MTIDRLTIGSAPVEIRIAPFGSGLWREMVALRRDVLRAPLGLAFAEAELADERADIHLALVRDGELAGTLLLRPTGPDGVARAKFRQMAVRPRHRGTGCGSALLRAGEDHARALGLGHGTLNARVEALGFYERQGWRAEGDRFVEVTLPHLRMGKRFAP